MERRINKWQTKIKIKIKIKTHPNCQAPNFWTKLRVSISAFNNLVTGAGGA